LLPVTAIRGRLYCLRHALASVPSASLLSRMRDGGDGALGARFRDEVVGVEPVALQRHEQVAGLQRAGVGVDPLHLHVAVAHELAAGPGGRLLKFEHGVHFLAPSAFAACARSENACFTPAISW
jgi:hypothetical protein